MQEPLLSRALRSACAAHPSRTALTGGGVALTYDDWRVQAGALARRLVAEGPVRGQPVMVRCSNHPSDFVAFFGVWMAGAVVVPVHRTAPPEVVKAMQAKARCALAVDLLRGAPDDAAAIERFEVDGTATESRRRMLDDGALVIFTSGSTGQPKGVVLSHRAFSGKLAQNQRLFQVGPGTVTLLVLNDTFSFGIWVALMTLLQGGRVATMGRFTPQAFLDALCDEGVDFVGVVPTMVRATFGTLGADALAAARSRLAATARLRQVVIGGEPLGAALSAELRRFIAPAELFDVYGLTETSTSDFVLRPHEYAEHPGSIGRPFPGIDFRLVGGDGRPCAQGEVGELQLRTPYLMGGYLDDEAQTAAAFSDDGWLRTGDLASADGQGFVTIAGRLKELIVRGGNKITPLEVERALLKCEGVAQAMAVGLPDAILGQRIHVLLVPRPGARLVAASIRQALTAQLERYKMPDAYYVGDALPTGRTGKVDRGQLPQWLAAGSVQRLAE